MRTYFILVTGITPFLATLNTVTAQACAAGTAEEIMGNWYCSEVKAVTYANFPGFGSYEKITDMDEDTGECSSVHYNYKGSLSPLNEELSLHIRGPTSLKQLAVYMPATTANKKRSAKLNGHHRRHAAGPVHRHHGKQPLHHHHGKVKEAAPVEQRAVGDLVSATIDGQLVSWKNVYAGPGSVTDAPVGDVVSATIDGQIVSWTNTYAGPAVTTDAPVLEAVSETSASTSEIDTTEYADVTSQSSISSPTTTTVTSSSTSSILPAAGGGYADLNPQSSTSSSTTNIVTSTSISSTAPAASGGWARQAYFNAASGTVESLTFLNHFGGEDGIPGTSAGGPAFGTSLSYASADGQSGAASPQVLSNAMIEDDTEVIIMTNRSCDDGDCGYTRSGGVAYHGFSGAQKVFLLEFSMPLTNSTAFNGDMPAIWLLNAQIPLTSQYGTNPDCSCWTSGCGEFDLFEILDSGNTRCKSTLHMAPAGGSSDWFRRPVSGSIVAAVIIAGEHAAIRVLNGEEAGSAFDTLLSGEVVDGWVGDGNGAVFDLVQG